MHGRTEPVRLVGVRGTTRSSRSCSTCPASAPATSQTASCNFMAGEDTTFSGHAVGWVSGDLAWLVTTPDKATTKATLAAMKSARPVP